MITKTNKIKLTKLNVTSFDTTEMKAAKILGGGNMYPARSCLY